MSTLFLIRTLETARLKNISNLVTWSFRASLFPPRLGNFFPSTNVQLEPSFLIITTPAQVVPYSPCQLFKNVIIYSCLNMSTSTIEVTTTPILYNPNDNSVQLNPGWQVWDSRSISPRSDIHASEPRSISGSVITVTDDGWRNAIPREGHLDVAPTASPTHLPYNVTSFIENHSAPQVGHRQFSHPHPYICPIPSTYGDVPLYVPFLSRESHQLPFIGMPMENNFRVPNPPILMSPAFPVPGHYPFTDHFFGFEPGNHLTSTQIPSQVNIANPPNFIYPNSIPIPCIPDTRMMPLVPFDYLPHPPQYFFPPPLAKYSPPPPISQISGVGNNLACESRHEPPIASPSPRRTRVRQPRSSSSGSSHSRNRNGHRGNQTGLPLGARSSVMEEFRSNKDKHWSLKDIFGHVVEFSGDQNGSRFIQQQLEDASEEDKHQIFDEIVPSHTSQLIQDVFGNYVVQKFFDLGNASQKDIISQEIEANVINYSVHIYACRVVQKAFDYMSEEQQDRIIDRLAGNLLTCIKDQHGNHVIQKLIDTVTPERLTFMRIISANIPDLAASSTGCRVLQRCLSKLPKAQLKPVLDAVDRHCDSLMKDQFGNYVIQFILQHGDNDDKTKIMVKIRGSMVKLSKNQYASHVCEKAITYSRPEDRSTLISEILTRTEDGHPIPAMMKDDFANYVLQRALAMAEGEQRVVLFHQVKFFLMPLRRSADTYSKQLFKIERLVERYFGKMDKAASDFDP